MRAVWDTGATLSVISERLAKRLGVPRGNLQVYVVGANTAGWCDACFVNIGLPEGISFPPLKATILDLHPNYDVLIGMDIIGRGDFAVSQRDGQTLFSYRTPPQKCIDFKVPLAA